MTTPAIPQPSSETESQSQPAYQSVVGRDPIEETIQPEPQQPGPEAEAEAEAEFPQFSPEQVVQFQEQAALYQEILNDPEMVTALRTVLEQRNGRPAPGPEKQKAGPMDDVVKRLEQQEALIGRLAIENQMLARAQNDPALLQHKSTVIQAIQKYGMSLDEALDWAKYKATSSAPRGPSPQPQRPENRNRGVTNVPSKPGAITDLEAKLKGARSLDDKIAAAYQLARMETASQAD